MKKFDFIQSKIFHFNNNDDRIKIAQTLSFLRFKEKKIIFTNGCFDIIHLGHIDYLSKAADLGNHLIIGLNSDISIKKIKGNNLDLSEHVKSIVKEYGSIRKTAKALGISDSYIKNMVKGTRTNPSRGILLGLGLRKVITEHYERICFK